MHIKLSTPRKLLWRTFPGRIFDATLPPLLPFLRVESPVIKAVTTAMVLGEQILLGVIVLEDLDLMVDYNRNRLVPYQGTWDQPVFRV